MSTQQLKTHFSVMDAVSLGWNVINVWGGLSVIFVVGFNAGGIPALFYGFMGCSVGVGCIMAVFAECSSYFATAGGAYHFTAFLTPQKHRRGVSYVIGYFNYFGYVLTYAGCSSCMAFLTTGLINLCAPEFDVTIRWRLFVLYIFWAAVGWVTNIIGIQIIGILETLAYWLILASFVGFSIAMLVLADKATPAFVFKTVFNNTGYSSKAMAVVIGLFNTMVTWMALDGPVHIAEEMEQPLKVMPKVLYITFATQAIVGLVWILVCGFCITDMEAIINSPTGVPVVEMVRLATKSTAAAIVFDIVLALNLLAALLGVVTATSRQGMAFARDGGLFWKDKLTYINPRFNVPLWSVTMPFVLTCLIGLVYLFSSLGFNAIIGSQAAFFLTSFMAPATIMLLTRRSTIPRGGKWGLGRYAYPICGVAVLYGIAVLAIVPIPQVSPLTGENMNYVCVIVSACTILIGLTWLFEARKTYTPPVYEHCEFIFGSTTLGRLDSETGPDITDQQRKDASHHFVPKAMS